MAIAGYIYLHENGALIYRRIMPGIIEDFENSTFVRKYWPIEPQDRRGAWRIIIEATAEGADPAQVFQRARTWHCTDADALEYAKREGIHLLEETGYWYAAKGGQLGVGHTPLDAFAALFLKLHPKH